METDYARNVIAATLLIAFGVAFAWGQASPPPAAPTYRAVAPIATLMPTPRIHIPAPTPAPVVPAHVTIERVESGGSVTVNNVDVNVRMCILASCP